MNDAIKLLREFQSEKKFFIGIDSDGCVFDSMGIKQRECFCPQANIQHAREPITFCCECKKWYQIQVGSIVVLAINISCQADSFSVGLWILLF